MDQNDCYQRILFCRVAYANSYDGNPDDELRNGGSYIHEYKTGGEIKNFYKESDGYYYGFFEPGGYKGKRHQLHVEKIDKIARQQDFLDHVLVVFIATTPAEIATVQARKLGQVIVGWYQNATVYREIQTIADGREYNLKCKIDDGVLLPPENRDFYPKDFLSPDCSFIGQSNVWYLEAKTPAAVEGMKEFKVHLLEYITNISGYCNKTSIESDGSLLYEEGRKRQIESNIYERNPEARKKCIEHYGAKCAVCGFEASEVYGDEFAGKIEVHHVVPISERNGSYVLDPIKDLIPVCPNCHMILHSGMNGCLIQWQELKKRLEKRKSK